MRFSTITARRACPAAVFSNRPDAHVADTVPRMAWCWPTGHPYRTWGIASAWSFSTPARSPSRGARPPLALPGRRADVRSADER